MQRRQLFDIIKIYTPIRIKRGIDMRFFNLTKKVFCFALVIALALFCTMTAFAEGEDETLYAEPQTEYVEPQTEYVEPVTQAPETEPYVQTDPPAPTEYVPEITEAEPTEAVTDAPSYEEPTYIQNVEPVPETTAYFEAPTLAKTVSTKQYTTNYTAGIVSWACVGIGVLAVAVVMISTKVSGRKNAARR